MYSVNYEQLGIKKLRVEGNTMGRKVVLWKV